MFAAFSPIIMTGPAALYSVRDSAPVFSTMWAGMDIGLLRSSAVTRVHRNGVNPFTNEPMEFDGQNSQHVC